MSYSKHLKNSFSPCLVWLNGLSAHLQTEKSLVQFPVRAQGQVPLWGLIRSMFLPHIHISFPLLVSPFPSL